MLERRKYFAFQFIKALHKNQRVNNIPPLAIFNHDVVGRMIFTNGFYEAPELRCVHDHILPKLHDRRLFLDIGANIGNHTAFLAPHFKSVKSFEPNPRTAKLLEANAMLFPNVEVCPYGLSNTESQLEASFDDGNVGAATLSETGAGSKKVTFHVKRLDDQLTPQDRASVSMIKIDVEGHELEALKGAVQILSESAPIILMEANRSEISDGTTAAKTYLESLGYTFFYYLQDMAPFGKTSRPLAKLTNSLSVLFRSKKIAGNYLPVRLVGKLQGKRDYKMLIASKSNLGFD